MARLTKMLTALAESQLPYGNGYIEQVATQPQISRPPPTTTDIEYWAQANLRDSGMSDIEKAAPIVSKTLPVDYPDAIRCLQAMPGKRKNGNTHEDSSPTFKQVLRKGEFIRSRTKQLRCDSHCVSKFIDHLKETN
jgi:hypothetical protein